MINEIFDKINEGEGQTKVKDLPMFEFGDNSDIGNYFVWHVKEFDAEGDFNAVNSAREYVKEMGMTVGPMCSDSPMGFASAEKHAHVAKWRNINSDEYDLLSGVIITLDPDGFREGGAAVVFFEDPEVPSVKMDEKIDIGKKGE